MLASHPNILLIVVDDHRADALGCLGHPAVQTPHLDKLAGGGTHFTHTFTSVPICTPARAELLTGRCAFRNGVPWFHYAVPEHIAWMPEVFRSAGYQTFFTGKWHNDGSPADHGFQTVRRLKNGGMWDHELTFQEENGPVTGFSTDLFAAAASEFISAPSEAPWFAYVAFTAPHDPRTPPPDYAALYEPDEIPLPANYLPEHPFDNGEMTIRDEQLEVWPRTPEAIRQHLADYYGMISHLDAGVGEILEALERCGQAENTVVVYVGDHGLAIGSHGLMGKMSLYDHSTRVPFILRGPGVPEGLRSEALCQSYDLFPTLCDLAGISVPATVEGRSLGPVLRGESPEHRETVYCAYQHPLPSDAPVASKPLHHLQRMARDSRWKYIEYPFSGRRQLFDLETDPHELCDLLADWRQRPAPGYQPPFDVEAIGATAAQLQGELRAWQELVGDPLREGNPSPQPAIVD